MPLIHGGMAVSFPTLLQRVTLSSPYHQDGAVAPLDNLDRDAALKEPRHRATALRSGNDQIRLLPTHYFYNLIACGTYPWELPDAITRFFKFGRFLREQFLPCFLHNRIPQKRHDMYQEDNNGFGIRLDFELLGEELPSSV